MKLKYGINSKSDMFAHKQINTKKSITKLQRFLPSTVHTSF